MVDIEDFQTQARGLVNDRSLGYDQKLRRLSSLAVNALPYPELSPLCAEALQARVICDMYEGNRPFTPRYVLPDYAKALRNGVAYLELEPPQNLDDALAFLIILLIRDAYKGLIVSQMMLSIQLPITIFLQIYLTSSEKVMGRFKNSRTDTIALWTIGLIVSALNIALLVTAIF